MLAKKISISLFRGGQLVLSSFVSYSHRDDHLCPILTGQKNVSYSHRAKKMCPILTGPKNVSYSHRAKQMCPILTGMNKCILFFSARISPFFRRNMCPIVAFFHHVSTLWNLKPSSSSKRETRSVLSPSYSTITRLVAAWRQARLTLHLILPPPPPPRPPKKGHASHARTFSQTPFLSEFSFFRTATDERGP